MTRASSKAEVSFMKNLQICVAVFLGFCCLILMIDIHSGPTELVPHFAHRGSSQRRKGAASHIIDMVWLHRSPIWGGGVLLLFQMKTTCLRGASGRGESCD